MAKRSKARPERIRILFIGNSFTARNDLPGLLTQLTGGTIQTQLIQRGGASLRMHLNKGDAAAAMREEKFDYVVLQEQSTLPIKNPTRMHESVREFDQLIRAAGAKTVLYMTWSRLGAAADAQQRIANAYGAIGKELSAIVVPVGLAWRAFLATHKSPVLHDPDLSHPTLAGSYLAACTFHATLFGDAPPGEPSAAEKLELADRAALRETAVKAARTFVAK
jgi:hypothetical protein